jgi:hypothetical protein
VETTWCEGHFHTFLQALDPGFNPLSAITIGAFEDIYGARTGFKKVDCLAQYLRVSSTQHTHALLKCQAQTAGCSTGLVGCTAGLLKYTKHIHAKPTLSIPTGDGNVDYSLAEPFSCLASAANPGVAAAEPAAKLSYEATLLLPIGYPGVGAIGGGSAAALEPLDEGAPADPEEQAAVVAARRAAQPGRA